MGSTLRFYTQEEINILKRIEDNLRMKRILKSELLSTRDEVIMDSIEDIDLEIRELLLDLEAREKDNLMRSKVNKRVLKVSRWRVYFFWWIIMQLIRMITVLLQKVEIYRKFNIFYIFLVIYEQKSTLTANIYI